jgi:hypothetical protein
MRLFELDAPKRGVKSKYLAQKNLIEIKGEQLILFKGVTAP